MFKKLFQLVLFTGITGASLTAFGHANVVPKDNNDDYANRQYEEATTAYLKLNIAHACKVGSGGVERRNTRHFAVVFPNNIDLTDIAATFDVLRLGGENTAATLTLIENVLTSKEAVNAPALFPI